MMGPIAPSTGWNGRDATGDCKDAVPVFRGAAEASGCAYRDAEGVFDGLKGSGSPAAHRRLEIRRASQSLKRSHAVFGASATFPTVHLAAILRSCLHSPTPATSPPDFSTNTAGDSGWRTCPSCGPRTARSRLRGAADGRTPRGRCTEHGRAIGAPLYLSDCGTSAATRRPP